MLQSIKSVISVNRGRLVGPLAQFPRFYSEKPTNSDPLESSEASSNDATTPETTADDYTSRLEAADNEFVKLRDEYLKSVADFRNLQATTKREIIAMQAQTLHHFARDLMTTVDHLDASLAKIPAEWKLEDYVSAELHSHPKLLELYELYEGMQLTQLVLEKTLAEYGLAKFEPIGLKFDPILHEKVDEVAADKAGLHPGMVSKVLQTGFTWKGQCMRPAKVEVTVEEPVEAEEKEEDPGQMESQ